MNEILSDPTYKIVMNPTNPINLSTYKMVKASAKQHKHLQTSDPIPSKMYGHPKIH